MNGNPITFKEWGKRGESYPTVGVLYNWTRPGETRDQMVKAGVIVRVNNRWLFNPSQWRAYCARQVAA